MVERGLVGEVRELKDRGGNVGQVNVSFYLGKNPLGGEKIFVPLSHEQLSAMHGFARWHPEVFQNSQAILSKDHRTNTVKLGIFYPFGEIGRDTTIAAEVDPRGKGIAREVHAKLAEFIANRFPGHLINHGSVLTPEGKRFFRRAGINPNKNYEVEKYLEKVRGYKTAKRGGVRDALRYLSSFF